ncbi:MAG TPA: YetF domain-containing protein [Bdellovibrionota bacterium]|jgi:uncharacterized membrane protein YcaP (DUF421 family)|nr:YetF domain-containing protein [Bdellovibrionota bacterium]
MEFIIRITVVVVFIMIVLRLIGKRDFAELSSFDLVMIMLIPEIVSKALGKQDYSLTTSLVATMTLVGLVFLMSILSYRFRRIGKVLEGEPTLLAYGGRVLRENLDQERVSLDEIYAQLRIAGYERLDQVKAVVLEADGDISVVAPDRHNPVTVKAGKFLG